MFRSRNRYHIKKKLGEGSFGEVFLGYDRLNGQTVAIKREKVNSRHPQLLHEAKIFQIMCQDGKPEGFLDYYYSGRDVDGKGKGEEYNLLVMEMQGASLESLFEGADHKFSHKTIFMLGFQMIARLRDLHARGILHRDIKPDNFLIGLKSNSHMVYICDMGLSTRLPNEAKIAQGPRNFGKNQRMTGTVRYASINVHLGYEQSQRDDLQALTYVLTYFLNGEMPWSGIKARNTHEKYTKIMNKKISIPDTELLRGKPVEFLHVIQYVKSLNYGEVPDYDRAQEMLAQGFMNRNYESDMQFDWTPMTDPLFKKPQDRRSYLKKEIYQQTPLGHPNYGLDGPPSEDSDADTGSTDTGEMTVRSLNGEYRLNSKCCQECSLLPHGRSSTCGLQ